MDSVNTEHVQDASQSNEMEIEEDCKKNKQDCVTPINKVNITKTKPSQTETDVKMATSKSTNIKDCRKSVNDIDDASNKELNVTCDDVNPIQDDLPVLSSSLKHYFGESNFAGKCTLMQMLAYSKFVINHLSLRGDYGGASVKEDIPNKIYCPMDTHNYVRVRRELQ